MQKYEKPLRWIERLSFCGGSHAGVRRPSAVSGLMNLVADLGE